MKNLSHKKIQIGPLPFIDDVLQRLNFWEVLRKFVKNERYVGALEVLLKSILIEPSALYRIPEWAALYEPERMAGGEFRDDGIGRALDKLFAVDRATLQTELVLNAVNAYQLDTSRIHNDSTTIQFYGAYKKQSSKTIKLKRGHSKDHRPDLKQLVYNLSVTGDGAIPVHFKCHDGNRTDDTLHVETWLTLRGMLGRSDFLYVADSKLCTTENLLKIDREGGRFVTIVPDTRSETKEFADRCYECDVRWEPLTRRASTRKSGSYDVFQVAGDFFQLSEGFRLYWYRSSEKRKRDFDSRDERIEFALEKLNEIQRERRRGPKTEKGLLTAAQKVLKRYHAEKWIAIEVHSRQREEFKKTSRGKPAPQATYRRLVKQEPYLVISKQHEAIARSAATDGIFPLTTNAKLGAKETLEAYKYQPFLEKRFSWKKSDYLIAPVFLKKTERIEALMFAHYMADLVAALLQRQLRSAMKVHKIRALQTLPEERPSETPTWEQIQRLFNGHAKYELRSAGSLVTTFWDDLSSPQQHVITLLEVPLENFAK